VLQESLAGLSEVVTRAAAPAGTPPSACAGPLWPSSISTPKTRAISTSASTCFAAA
jgi:hypothetical protein